jgi:hypothetical protein
LANKKSPQTRRRKPAPKTPTAEPPPDRLLAELDPSPTSAGEGAHTGAPEGDDDHVSLQQAPPVDDPFAGANLGFGDLISRPPFVEEFLIAIIRAHPTDGTARDRLETAMLALFGHKSSGRPFPGEDKVETALLWMAEERHRLRAAKGRVSDRSLASQAAQRFFNVSR